MSGKAVGRAAVALPWLCPNTDDLLKLAEAPAGLARPCDTDPALLSFLLRFAPPATSPITGLFCPTALAVASLPETAAAYLNASRAGWVEPTCEVAKRCRVFTAGATRFARRLAEHTRRACPDRAAALVALAPLGWLAVAAVDHGLAAEALHDPDAPPVGSLQAEVWGLDQNAIARRLANRWRLPDWIGTALGNFSLSLSVARSLVPDLDLFAVAQLAVVEAERRICMLGLATEVDRSAALAALKLDAATADELWSHSPAEVDPRPAPAFDPNPHAVPLVANLLKMAGESRRRNGAALVLRLEDRVDELHRAVARAGTESDDRARDAKLAALAELAAGAGHEINNPLAVISGNAQRLARSEPDPDRGASLQTIIRQSQRIAGIVRDLMQFARPPQPKPHRTAASGLLTAVRDDLAAFAAEKGVRIELAAAPAAFVRCDVAQIKHALSAVVRNGIEAAGAGGCVRVVCTDGPDEFVEFVVEDSGPGLSAAALEHCFDPFFCGRSAGRGRGLGLPTAWQFARQNGGDLRHEPNSSGATRFVLCVPRSVTLEFLDRQSA
jgi:two-component system, NtrC family, sensor kinase